MTPLSSGKMFSNPCLMYPDGEGESAYSTPSIPFRSEPLPGTEGNDSLSSESPLFSADLSESFPISERANEVEGDDHGWVPGLPCPSYILSILAEPESITSSFARFF